MDAEGIYFKKVDRMMYRNLKSAAAQKGVPVYVLLNEAIADYVRSLHARGTEKAVSSQEALDNAAYRAVEADGSLRGKWVGIANGKVVASADDETTVVQRMRRVYSSGPFRHGIIALVGGRREEREWLAGSLQRQD